jgi:hypothetical protein
VSVPRLPAFEIRAKGSHHDVREERECRRNRGCRFRCLITIDYQFQAMDFETTGECHPLAAPHGTPCNGAQFTGELAAGRMQSARNREKRNEAAIVDFVPHRGRDLEQRGVSGTWPADAVTKRETSNPKEGIV